MKYVKYLMALAALCILAMPAFSMPDERSAQNDGNDQAVEGQAPAMGPAGEDFQQPCDCHAPMGQDGKKMPCGRHIKSMMGEKGPAFGAESKMCGCGEKGPESRQAQEGNGRVKCMMGEKGHAFGAEPKMCGCGEKGPESGKHVKSMMGEMGPESKCCEHGPMGDQGPEGHKHIKSMMGGMNKPGHVDAKTIIVNVNL